MVLFGKTKISAPVAVVPPMADVQFAHTTIYVRNSVIPQTGGQYGPTALQHLAEIQGFPAGQLLLNAITALGKKQVVKYGGPNTNQAAGGGLSSYKLLRRYHDSDDKVNFAAELQTTVAASTHNKRWLADQAYRTQLPLWSGSSSPSPLRNLPLPPRPVGGARALPPTPVDRIESLIDTWLAGTALPSRDEMDIVCLVLEQWLRNGTGTNTLISYDPHKVMVGGTHRPPQVALFHELVHAYYNAAGGQLGREDSLNEGNGGRLFELMAVGLPPFNLRPYSENQFRASLGVGLRASYP